MVLRACNSPQLIGPVVSRDITTLVDARAKAMVANILQKQNADAAGLPVALSTGKKEEGAQAEAPRGLSRRHREQNYIHLK